MLLTTLYLPGFMLSVIYYASCLYINDCTFLISQLILTSVGQRTVLWTVLLADVKGQSPLGLQYKQLGQITRTVTATSRCGWLPTVSGTQSSPSPFFLFKSHSKVLQNKICQYFQLTNNCSDKMFRWLGRYTQQYKPTVLLFRHPSIWLETTHLPPRLYTHISLL